MTAGERPVVLVLRALGLGDLLTAVPALRALADAFPEHEKVLAAPASLERLALHTGAVDRVVDAGALAPLPWRGERPHVAVNLHGRGPQSHAVLLAVGARELMAFAHPDVKESAGGPAWREGEHEVARWCRMLEGNGVPADASRIDLARPADVDAPGSRRAWERARGATILHPGAASGARRWPPQRWIEVARALAKEGRRVVLTGGPEEVGLAREIAASAGLTPEDVLAGRTSPMDLVRAVAVAERVACGDTGIAHVATALRCPSVVLFGPTPPAWWGPPADRPWHRALWAGETGDPHAATPSPGLLQLTVDDVLAALSDLPAAHRRGAPARRDDARAFAFAPPRAGYVYTTDPARAGGVYTSSPPLGIDVYTPASARGGDVYTHRGSAPR